MVIKLTQNGCSKFKIYGASFVTITDVTCTGNPLTASYDVTFKYTGEIKCLTKIKLNPKFYTANNTPLTADYIDEISTEGNPQVTINESAKTCTFRFDFTFDNSTDANNFNHCYLLFHTENSQGESSKDAKVRMTGSCSEIVPGGYDTNPKATVTVFAPTIQLRLWDDAAEDGDIVSVYLNGNQVLQNHMLTNAGNTFTVGPILPGNNDLVLVAMNQGSSGPNTCALSVNGGTTTTLNLDLTTGQMIRINW